VTEVINMKNIHFVNYQKTLMNVKRLQLLAENKPFAKGIYALLLTAFYPPLAEIANPGNAAVGIDMLYPAEHSVFLERCN
jgi:hypothetical protein